MGHPVVLKDVEEEIGQSVQKYDLLAFICKSFARTTHFWLQFGIFEQFLS